MNTHIKLSVCAVIVCEGRFLVVKRSPIDDFLPNCWEFVGGGVQEKETVKNALIREIKEEVGLDISDKNTKLIGFSEEFMADDSRYFQLNYEIKLTIKPNIILSDEHCAYDWVDEDDLRLDTFLKDIIEQLKNS